MAGAGGGWHDDGSEHQFAATWAPGFIQKLLTGGLPKGKSRENASGGVGYKPSFAGIFTLLRPRRPHSGGLGNRSSRRFLRNQGGGCEWVTVWLVRSSKAGGTPALRWSDGGWRMRGLLGRSRTFTDMVTDDTSLEMSLRTELETILDGRAIDMAARTGLARTVMKGQ